mmetsp:Transcript_68795/g.165116  ORF Transcript_68795/g.165116 Transcript_68795/m.165116 type:complete len:398 (+) Transcript_68795:77-1270(+)
MKRASLLMNVRRCHYDVLGVAPTATTDDIKRAFREAAKRTHPDAGGTSEGSGFRSLVEAYRILRDPRKRSEYDNEKASGFEEGRRRYYGADADGGYWSRRAWSGVNRGPREPSYHDTASDEARAHMYGYARPKGKQREDPNEEDFSSSGRGGILGMMLNEKGAVMVLFGSLAAMFVVTKQGSRDHHDDHPSRKPKPRLTDVTIATDKAVGQALHHRSESSDVATAVAPVSAAAGFAPQRVATARDAPPQASPVTILQAQERRESAKAVLDLADPGPTSLMDEIPQLPPDVGYSMVRSFYDPFSETWQSIPDGFEAPGALDLTAWHKRRTDPTEWSRLFAEGKLSEIAPRGSLKVQYRPRYDTYPAVLLCDPVTGKTVTTNSKYLPPKVDRNTCEVKF